MHLSGFLVHIHKSHTFGVQSYDNVSDFEDWSSSKKKSFTKAIVKKAIEKYGKDKVFSWFD